MGQRLERAVIMLGGKGTRMGISTPKSLLEKDGKPFLDYIIDHLKSNGITDITFKVNDRTEFNAPPYKEYNKIRSLDDMNSEEDYLVTTGDILVDYDIGEMYRHHLETGTDVTVLTREEVIPYGVIQDGTFVERPTLEIAVGALIIKSGINAKSIPDLTAGKNITTFKTENPVTHLTNQEDYEKWKSS